MGHNSRRSRRSTSRSHREEPVLITDARVSPRDDRHRREITYSILQFIRVPSLILAFYLYWWHDMWVLPALLVGVTVPLPWIAVVIANGQGQPKDKREKNVYKPAIARQIRQHAEAEALAASNASRTLDASDPDAVIDHDVSDDPPSSAADSGNEEENTHKDNQ